MLVKDVNLTNGIICSLRLVARTTVYHTLCSYINIDSAVLKVASNNIVDTIHVAYIYTQMIIYYM